MKNRTVIPWVDLDVPEGWEVSTEIAMREPKRARLAVRMAKPETEQPRATLTISSGATEHRHAQIALDDFLDDLMREAPNLKAIDQGGMKFDDGSEGVYRTIAFDAMPGLRIAQRHIFRVHDRRFTHLTITVASQDQRRIEQEFMSIICSIRAVGVVGSESQ